MPRSQTYVPTVLILSVPVALLVLLGVAVYRAQAAAVESDGGIVLVVSYGSSDVVGGSGGLLDASVEESPEGVSSSERPASTCKDTNSARSDHGAGGSPGSCATVTGGPICAGRKKLEEDLHQLARYIHQSTQGKHHLKKVYVVDDKRLWKSVDVTWDMGVGATASGTIGGGWDTGGAQLDLQNASRTCIHEVLHHEIGHYLYGLGDRYRGGAYDVCDVDAGYAGSGPSIVGYYKVTIDQSDTNTVMSEPFPHDFVDSLNAKLGVSYVERSWAPNPPDSEASPVVSSSTTTTLTAADQNPRYLGNNECKTPFGLDEWTVIAEQHRELKGVHEVGVFPAPDFSKMESLDIEFVPSTAAPSGMIVAMNGSSTTSNATLHLQEAGLFLYHSAKAGNHQGAYLFAESPMELYGYQLYEPSRGSFTNFPLAASAGPTAKLAKAIEAAIDSFEELHGDAALGRIVVVSDGPENPDSMLWEQLDRAVEAGVQIHALTFQSAETGTLRQLAEDSSGSIKLVSDPSDPEALKRDIVREISRLRGETRIYDYTGPPPGAVPDPGGSTIARSVDSNGDPTWTGSFLVPRMSEDLVFYVFMRDQNAGEDLTIELTHPNRTIPAFEGNAIAEQGRFNGVRVSNVEEGEWTFTIAPTAGATLPTDGELYVVASVLNADLNAELWIEDRHRASLDADGGITQVETSILKSTLKYQYPLSDIKVEAVAYAANQQVRDPMRDGNKVYEENVPRDGVYSADIGFFDQVAGVVASPKQKVRINVEFEVTNNALPAAYAHYEPGIDPNALVADYAARFSGTRFFAYATLITRLEPPASMPGPPTLIPPGGLGFKKRGTGGSFDVVLENARPLLRRVRVSLGQGVSAQAVSVSTRPDFGSRIRVEYIIQDIAREGPRDLDVQFGTTAFVRESFMTVMIPPSP